METFVTANKVPQEKEFPLFRYHSCCPEFLKNKKKRRKKILGGRGGGGKEEGRRRGS